ncbi:hypothetical protein F2P81_011717 [Scophthalmus maximus]|uniref:Uncharacterized protein n=1 Tax=Scophthalmus maximus TaxID=52904 RepID=A0A6A4SUQ0_SCOMX|nr:hypothetical protein F2P81_011717 [Scophthalmus maximus]
MIKGEWLTLAPWPRFHQATFRGARKDEGGCRNTKYQCLYVTPLQEPPKARARVNEHVPILAKSDLEKKSENIQKYKIQLLIVALRRYTDTFNNKKQ